MIQPSDQEITQNISPDDALFMEHQMYEHRRKSDYVQNTNTLPGYGALTQTIRQ
jgi:hypothetical protein